jgi:hypothetical protein
VQVHTTNDEALLNLVPDEVEEDAASEPEEGEGKDAANAAKPVKKTRNVRKFSALEECILEQEDDDDFKKRVIRMNSCDALKNSEALLVKLRQTAEDQDNVYEGSIDLLLTDMPWQVMQKKHDKIQKSKMPQLAEAWFGLVGPTGNVLLRLTWQMAGEWMNALTDAGFMVEPQLLVVVKNGQTCKWRTNRMHYRSNAHSYYLIAHKSAKYYESAASGGYVLENKYPHLASVISGVPRV